MNYLNNLDEGKLSEERVRHIFTQLASGVQEIHNQGIVHCDLKHKNIYVSNVRSENPEIKIGDFGLACKLDKDECIIARAGTMSFMAPEIVLKQPSDYR